MKKKNYTKKKLCNATRRKARQRQVKSNQAVPDDKEVIPKQNAFSPTVVSQARPVHFPIFGGPDPNADCRCSKN